MSYIGQNACIAATAVIHEGATIGAGAVIHDFVVIYPGVEIGANTEIFDHCVLGKPPKSSGSTARPLKEHYEPTIVGEACVLCPGVVLYSDVQIGDHTLLGDYCSVREECRIGSYCAIGRNSSVNYATTIGHHTKIMDNAVITGNMTVGNHVFISMSVVSSNDNAMGGTGSYDEKMRGPTVCDYAKIGAAANILPNVVIGTEAVVAAGSVVTKDVPPRKVVMGIPARIVRDVQ